VGNFDVAIVAGCLEHGLYDAYVNFCGFEGPVAQYSFDVHAVRKKIERLGLEVVDPKAHKTTTTLQIPDELPNVEEVLKEMAGTLKATRTANHDKVDVQTRVGRLNNCLRFAVGYISQIAVSGA